MGGSTLKIKETPTSMGYFLQSWIFDIRSFLIINLKEKINNEILNNVNFAFNLAFDSGL